ncbi:MAG: Hsp20/alpha crystallin family protein [Kutzneria sp.]|nr:Hsp20/alpha crystallin family protein [Kutzneria sp.]
MALPMARSSGRTGRWDPLREFEDLYGQMGRWMDAAFGRAGESGTSWLPAADVSETDEAYLVEVDLPGVKREDITIDLVGNELTVSGELKEMEREGWFRRRTRRTGRFEYRVSLPHDVDTDKIDANLADGVLTVRVPKSEAAKPRRITVSGS